MVHVLYVPWYMYCMCHGTCTVCAMVHVLYYAMALVLYVPWYMYCMSTTMCRGTCTQ